MKTDSIDAFRDSARDFLSRFNQIQRLRALRDTAPGFERKIWEEMGHAGWFSILVPEEYGGLGLGLREVTAIAEEVGQHLLPEPFIGGSMQVIAVLCQVADSPLKARLLDGLVAGGLIAGLAWQEKLGQIESDQLHTTAASEGDEILLSGCKLAVVPGTGADGWIVSAAGADGVNLYWVPAGLPGLILNDEYRIDGSVMSTLTLDRVRVPRLNSLAQAEQAQSAVSRANDIARIAQGAELLGVARRALAIMLEYLNTRTQFGKQIGSFQAIQHRVVDVYIQTELAAACIADGLSMIEQDNTLTATLASRIKARCAHAALCVTRLAIQFHGAMGITDECDIGLYFKRALNLSAWLGNAASHRQRYAVLQPKQTVGAELSNAVDEFPVDVDWDAMPDAEFRQLVRGFFASRYPQHLRNPPRRLHWSEIKEWYFTLSRQGWIAPAWPKRFGGMGLAPDKLLAFIEEQEQYGVARAPDQGIVMIGPLLIRYGNAEQQQRFLPKILSGDNVWCQGYSEPNAGSDLAALRTEAVLDGNEFVVNGQKTWTTLAQDATHIFTLVRTDKNVKKQSGISFLLIDLATPGITIRPIMDIAGHQEFCEVFFDKVRVPAANLVGEQNQGWGIAKALLGFERIFLGSPKQSQYALAQLDALAEARDLFSDAHFAAQYAEVQLDVADLCAAYAHFAAIVKRGEALPPDVSLLKIWGTETYQKIGMLLATVADENGGSNACADFDQIHLNVLAPLFNATSATIYGGANEIQRNIISKNVLHFPN